jgi:hypothetical protein
MSRRDHEPTVPLGDLYQAAGVKGGSLNVLPPEPELAEYLSRTYDVTVIRDHRNRLALTIPDAYKVRDVRLAAEAELQADWVAEQQRFEEVTAWSRARLEYWANQWMFTMRATPIPINQNQAQVKQTNAARNTLSVLVLAAEEEAGIPPDVQEQLSWPDVTRAYRIPESGESASDFPYVPPKEA